MGAISSKLRKWADPVSGQEGLTYWCQGCNAAHGIRTAGAGAWGWNGDVERPVFTPSVLTTYPLAPDARTDEEVAKGMTEIRCHTFVGCNGAQPGEVIFLDDCTHALRGAHPFPDLPDWLKD